jgi:hypothetical protein
MQTPAAVVAASRVICRHAQHRSVNGGKGRCSFICNKGKLKWESRERWCTGRLTGCTELAVNARIRQINESTMPGSTWIKVHVKEKSNIWRSGSGDPRLLGCVCCSEGRCLTWPSLERPTDREVIPVYMHMWKNSLARSIKAQHWAGQHSAPCCVSTPVLVLSYQQHVRCLHVILRLLGLQLQRVCADSVTQRALLSTCCCCTRQ